MKIMFKVVKRIVFEVFNVMFFIFQFKILSFKKRKMDEKGEDIILVKENIEFSLNVQIFFLLFLIFIVLLLEQKCKIEQNKLVVRIKFVVKIFNGFLVDVGLLWFKVLEFEFFK